MGGADLQHVVIHRIIIGAVAGSSRDPVADGQVDVGRAVVARRYCGDPPGGRGREAVSLRLSGKANEAVKDSVHGRIVATGAAASLRSSLPGGGSRVGHPVCVLQVVEEHVHTWERAHSSDLSQAGTSSGMSSMKSRSMVACRG